MILGGASGAAVTTANGVAATGGTVADGPAGPFGETEADGLADVPSDPGDFFGDIGAAGGDVADTAVSGATERTRCEPIQTHAPASAAKSIASVMILRLRMTAKWIACPAISCVLSDVQACP